MADALDPAALEALWGEGLLDTALPPAGPPLPPAERAAKRMREAELSLDAHLAFEAGARAPGDDARSAPADSGDDAPAGRGGRKGSADGAAKAKANRERARRERLNDFFAELVRAMEPATPHAVVRTDKASIVADAIRLITALRAENGQLRQLNKFMEARLAALERERAEAMVRAAYAAGAAAGGGGGAAAALSPGAGPSSAPAPPPPPAPELGALLPPADVDTSADGVRRPPAA